MESRTIYAMLECEKLMQECRRKVVEKMRENGMEITEDDVTIAVRQWKFTRD